MVYYSVVFLVFFSVASIILGIWPQTCVAKEPEGRPSKEKINARFQKMMEMIHSMLQRGMPVDSVMSREKAFRIQRMVEDGEFEKVEPLIESAIEALGRIERTTETIMRPFVTGTIRGTVVDEDGEKVEGVYVSVFGTTLKSISDEDGLFEISNVPVAAPRYIITATKDGYFETQMGDLNVAQGEYTDITVVMRRETQDRAYLREKLHVMVCYLVELRPALEPVKPDDMAVLEPSLYPDRVKPYLKPSKQIQSEHRLVKEVTKSILLSVPAKDRKKQTIVAKAVYDWVVKNINYDLIHNYPADVTCGNWQTTYGGWGKNFDDWCYTAADVLREKRAICIEYERLATALLRALNIPARPAPLRAHPVTQWWVQLPDGTGYWANMETSVGHTIFANTNDLWAKFPSVPDSSIAFYSIDEDAPIQFDWNAENRCLWFEDYGEIENYPLTDTGLKIAKNGLEAFKKTGKIPRGQQGALPDDALRTEPHYELYSRGFVLDLANIGDQRQLIVTFPIFMENAYRKTMEIIHWTNHPEWITRTWVEERSNEETGEKLSHYCIAFAY